MKVKKVCSSIESCLIEKDRKYDNSVCRSNEHCAQIKEIEGESDVDRCIISQFCDT